MTVDLGSTADPMEAPTPPPGDTDSHVGFVAVDFGTSNSTAVLYAGGLPTLRALDPAQVNRLREGLMELLTATTPDAGTSEQFTALLRRVARVVNPRFDPTYASDVLHAALRNEALAEARRDATVYREPAVTYLVLLGLEREVDSCLDPLRTWLRAKLHECYDAAFEVPGLESLRLFPVELDWQAASVELRSRVIVPASGSLDEGVMPADDSPPEAGSKVYSGLRGQIGLTDRRAGSGNDDLDVDALTAAGLRYLIKRVDAFIASNPKRYGKGRTSRVVATHPTVAPPTVRQKMHEMLTGRCGPEVQHVVLFDQAVAAAMYFFLREFGVQVEVGVEAAKSRYEQLNDWTWKQNVLVIDIGGGTTDIALLTATLTDRTPPEAGEKPWAGRYYVLTPTVRGSTGFLQLGGEYLTLRVFRWLKAEIVDLLLTADPEHYRSLIQALPSNFQDEDAGYRQRSLVEKVLTRENDHALFAILDDVVPTRRHSAPQHEHAFWLLWTMAETAKLRLARSDTEAHLVPIAQIRQLINATAAARGDTLPSLSALADDQIVLGAAQFAELLVEPVTRVIQRATNLVLAAFKGAPERLDRIILTGRSTAMPHVRKTLNAQFGRCANSGETVAWEPSAIELAIDYSKLATAIGAAWAQSIIWYRCTPEDIIRHLAEGKTHLDINIENLFATLPASFGLIEQDGQFSVRLPAGTELLQLDTDPVAKARSDNWEQLAETVTVQRELEPGHTSTWATMNVANRARDEGFECSQDVWPDQINYLLEIDDKTELSVLLCRDTPHYVVDTPAVDLVEAIRTAYGPEAINADGTLKTRLPGDLLAESLIAGSHSLDNAVIIRADEELVFDDMFYDSDDSNATARPGTGAAQTRVLPPPIPGPGGNRGGWTFSLRHAGSGEKKIGTLTCPVLGAGQLPTRYLVTIDYTGKLRVHAGAVPFRRAVSMREVEESPGRVLREKLTSAPPDYDEDRDPFNHHHLSAEPLADSEHAGRAVLGTESKGPQARLDPHVGHGVPELPVKVHGAPRSLEPKLRESGSVTQESDLNEKVSGRGIFISYRRRDEAAFAGRLYDRLELEFGRPQVFMDVDSLNLGVDFVEELENALSLCVALIVVIGRDWITSTDSFGNRRIDDSDDFVRLEIERALGRNIRVIPILVDGAPMPRRADLPESLAPLTRRQGHPMSNSRFRLDCVELVAALREIIGD